MWTYSSFTHFPSCLLLCISEYTFGLLLLKGNGRRTKDIFLKFQTHVNEIISERRDEMAKSTTPLKVDLLNMLLSIKDEDVEITEGHIISTLIVR